jgi:polysaccharide export outer membrane protein
MRQLAVFLLVAALGPAVAPASAQEPDPAQRVVGTVGSSLTLQPGDIVQIEVWGQEQYSGRFLIDETGVFQYPILGIVDTRTLTVAQLRDTLRTALEGLFTNPFVTITPLFRVAVLGEVRSPGLYTVDPTLSVLDLVALAGGTTPVGNLGKIRVLRSGAESRLSFEEEALRGRTLQEVGVRSGDQVIVPRRFFTRQDWWTVFQVVNTVVSVAILVTVLTGN